MAHPRGKNRDKLYQLVAHRDGSRCKTCGKFGSSMTLVVDHIDNNRKNNELKNLQLLCRRHNYLKNPRLAERENMNVQEAEPQSAEFEKNRVVEPRYRLWLMEMMEKHKRILKRDAINGGAEYVGCSPITIVRYLSKLTSIIGPFYLYADPMADETFVQWRTEYFPKPGGEQHAEEGNDA